MLKTFLMLIFIIALLTFRQNCGKFPIPVLRFSDAFASCEIQSRRKCKYTYIYSINIIIPDLIFHYGQVNAEIEKFQ